MKPQSSCRLQVEQLERREVPAVMPLMGAHAINTTITAKIVSAPFVSISGLSGSGTVVIDGSIGSGLLQGAAKVNGMVTSQMGSVFNFAGTLTITTKHGSVDTTDTGSVDIKALTFTDNATITGGTGRFRGVTGNLTATGTVNIIAESISGTLTGTLMGTSHQHHHPHHHRHQ
jgi:hypothetical protein